MQRASTDKARTVCRSQLLSSVDENERTLAGAGVGAVRMFATCTISAAGPCKVATKFAYPGEFATAADVSGTWQENTQCLRSSALPNEQKKAAFKLETSPECLIKEADLTWSLLCILILLFQKTLSRKDMSEYSCRSELQRSPVQSH